MKHLPKHLRPRWRYLAVSLENWPEADFDRNAFQRHVWFAAQNLLGDVGSAAIDLTVIRFESWDGGAEAIVRVRRGESDRARAVLACLADVDGEAVGLRVRGTSGTVRACEEKYMGGGPERTGQRHVAIGDAERPAVVRDGRVDYRDDDAFTGATLLDTE
ncbi:Rpp14/Pop5 family protein [Halapricum salinum]|uniref:Ribonuclease P protein component 2 n=1 Tax=Halapricum salinum TaxID=1457250 RepID=A0A4D6HGC3_9EURY|nr:Rpp14/Pop5 family protein [Halapricum salinum]QCC52266.1 ribonuclease P [Halapricum salinum]